VDPEEPEEDPDEGLVVGCARLPADPAPVVPFAREVAAAARLVVAELRFAGGVVLWPATVLAVISEMPPAATTAPPIIQRLTRRISAVPASRASIALLFMP